jgi:hypothetical protein
VPLKGVRYRVTTKGGKKVRLASRGKTVVEAKSLKTGAVHTESEFKAGRASKRKGRLRDQLARLRARGAFSRS